MTEPEVAALERKLRDWQDLSEDDEKQVLALCAAWRAQQADLERQLSEIVSVRRWLWLHHGCPPETLYGDDGEMQCNTASCCKDFRRDHLSDLFAHLRAQQQAEIARLTQRIENQAETMRRLSDGSAAEIARLREQITTGGSVKSLTI